MRILRLLIGTIAFLFGLMVVLFIFKDSLQYWSFDTDIGFLRVKERAVEQFGAFYLPAFYVHISSATLVGFLGLFQFGKWVRKKSLTLHRWLGKGYVLGVLLLAAPSGYLMAWFATGGMWGIICFLMLAMLWWIFTWMAWRKIRKGEVEAHRRWMVRSYALTAAAILLRFYLALSSNVFHINSPEMYVALAWASWVPNLVLVEGYFLLKKKAIPGNY